MFRFERVEPFIEVLRNSAEVDPLVALCVNEILCRLQHILGRVLADGGSGDGALTLCVVGMTGLFLRVGFGVTSSSLAAP